MTNSNRPFYAAEPSNDAEHLRLPVTNAVTVGPPGRPFLMGGVSLGAAITGLERLTGRPAVWATAQFLSGAGPNDVVELELKIASAGRSVSQGAAILRVKDRAIVTVQAALGARPDEPATQHVVMPKVPAPDACPPFEERPHNPDDLLAHVERRRAVDGEPVDHAGHGRSWFRTRAEMPVTAGLLAIYADFLAGTTDRTHGSSSLDNTLRIHRLVPTSWCLCDARIHGVANGFFHGDTQIFAEDGTLLATGSQTGALSRNPW